ncbi:uncharacterized protein G2W53_020200 [Senna tora]|uniref:Uncharacterized protein n=1 Tax=Senna tora TaxID=362788 RepID=A0A834TYK6_9FABA|nr:uncharacterized protein G2W53_020200 [Senna tora]
MGLRVRSSKYKRKIGEMGLKVEVPSII